jgi:hypothetical protein
MTLRKPRARAFSHAARLPSGLHTRNASVVSTARETNCWQQVLLSLAAACSSAIISGLKSIQNEKRGILSFGLEIQIGKRTEASAGYFIVGTGGLHLICEIAEMQRPASDFYLDHPFHRPLMPRDAPIF